MLQSTLFQIIIHFAIINILLNINIVMSMYIVGFKDVMAFT